MKENPDISKKAFWDIRFEDLDFEKNKEYIIAKVFEYGKWKDMLAITHYYGEKEVKEALKKSYNLSNNTIVFASIIFNLPKQEFQCYTQKQLQKKPWPF
ncbi:MAG: hypothetical protein WDO19_20005 [Bacteroidota bacterium]